MRSRFRLVIAVASGLAIHAALPAAQSINARVDMKAPAPRLLNGKPDFSGVWDHQYVPDMTATNRNPALQKGPKELPFSPAGLENLKNYDPVRDGDYTGMCMPYGLTRSFNGPFPIQIMQTDKHVGFLFAPERAQPTGRAS